MIRNDKAYEACKKFIQEQIDASWSTETTREYFANAYKNLTVENSIKTMEDVYKVYREALSVTHAQDVASIRWTGLLIALTGVGVGGASYLHRKIRGESDINAFFILGGGFVTVYGCFLTLCAGTTF